MVVFTCNECGTSLKKAQVEVHMYRCRNSQYVTCIDCSKDFWGNDYTHHIRCVTENEKYGGKNYVSKENKGQKKQVEWIQKVQDYVTARPQMNRNLRFLLDYIVKYDNLPRKKTKFMNFLQSNRFKDARLNQEAWAVMEKVAAKDVTSSDKPTNGTKEEDQPAKSESQNAEVSKPTASESQAEEEPERKKSKRERKEERSKKQTKIQKGKKRKSDENNVEEETEKPKKKKKKNKRVEEEEEEDEDEEANQENEEPGKDLNQEMEAVDDKMCSKASMSPFKWKKAISIVLKDAPEEGMKVKKLKRKVLALYAESKQSGYRKSELEIEALIQKKLNMRNDKFVTVKDRVKLRKN